MNTCGKINLQREKNPWEQNLFDSSCLNIIELSYRVSVVLDCFLHQPWEMAGHVTVFPFPMRQLKSFRPHNLPKANVNIGGDLNWKWWQQVPHPASHQRQSSVLLLHHFVSGNRKEDHGFGGRQTWVCILTQPNQYSLRHAAQYLTSPGLCAWGGVCGGGEEAMLLAA